MKYKLLILFIFLALIAKVNAQNILPPEIVIEKPNIPVKKTKVTAVKVVLDSSGHQANTSTTQYYFKAIISLIGAGTVSYQWVRSNPVNPAAHHLIAGTLTLSTTGTDVILITQGAAAGGSNSIFLQVLSPNAITSNTVFY